MHDIQYIETHCVTRTAEAGYLKFCDGGANKNYSKVSHRDWGHSHVI